MSEMSQHNKSPKQQNMPKCDAVLFFSFHASINDNTCLRLFMYMDGIDYNIHLFDTIFWIDEMID